MTLRVALVAAVVGLISLGGTACRSVSGDRAAASSLDAFLTTLHDKQMFDGAVVVSHHDRVVFAKGYGYADDAQQVAFTPDTATDGASLAKTFTAALLIALDRDGLLALDDPVQRFLPELPYARVTLRHLLSHTSGIPVHGYDYFDAFIPSNEVRTTESLLKVLASQAPPMAAEPGTSFEYSSFGYDLAALAAARAGGQAYGDLLRERLFRPAGITTAFARPGRLADFPPVRTRGYRRVAGKLELNEVFDLEAFHGGSNIYISARDLDRWNRAFIDGSIFTEQELSTMLAFATVNGRRSGLTLGSWYHPANGSSFWYSGHLQGFHSEVFRDLRDGWSIVYTSNNTIEPWLQKGLVRAIRRVLGGEEPHLTPPGVDRIARDERPMLAGRWTMQNGETVVIVYDTSPGMVKEGVTYSMFPEGDFFYVPGLDLIVGFAKGSSRIYLSSNVSEEWGDRAVSQR